MEEIEKVENKINLRMLNFSINDAEAKPKTYLNKIKKAYEKQFDIPLLRAQIKTMRFLLK